MTPGGLAAFVVALTSVLSLGLAAVAMTLAALTLTGVLSAARLRRQACGPGVSARLLGGLLPPTPLFEVYKSCVSVRRRHAYSLSVGGDTGGFGACPANWRMTGGSPGICVWLAVGGAVGFCQPPPRTVWGSSGATSGDLLFGDCRLRALIRQPR